MDYRRPNLPSNNGLQPMAPRRFDLQGSFSTESTGSVDSFMTQIPQPFHPHPYGFVPAAEPYTTPTIIQDSTMGALPVRQPPMGPFMHANSTAQYPGHSSQTSYGGGTSFGGSFQSQIGGDSGNVYGRPGSGESTSSSFQNQPTMIGGYYYNNGMFVPGPGQLLNGYQTGFQGQYPNSQYNPTPGPGSVHHHQSSYGPGPGSFSSDVYGNGNDYGHPVGPGAYNGFGNGNYMAPYPQPESADTYYAPSMGVASPVLDPQALPFNSGMQNSVTSQAWGNLYNPGNVNNGVGALPVNTGQEPSFLINGHNPNRFSSARVNDLSNGVAKGTKSAASGSLVSNKPKKKKPKKAKNKNKNVEKTGGVQALLGSLQKLKFGDVFNPTSAGISIATLSSRASSPGRDSGLSQISAINTDNQKVFKNDLTTPKARRDPVPAPSASERKETKTTKLRSGRSQTMTSVTSDPAQKTNITSWLENTPTNLTTHNPVEVVTDTVKRLPPPKMPDLRAMAGTATVGPVTPSDPFKSDPFISTTLTPYGKSTPFTAPYRGHLVGRPGTSKELAILTSGGLENPSIQTALDPRNLPFTEYCRTATPDEWGVIKIHNIPYSVSRQEILAFLGRNARIVPEQEGEAVHIIMERVTSKTLDCYVEFVNFNEAVAAVDRFETNRTGGRGGRLGQRHVEVELSSQECLMADLFPKAKNVRWSGARPNIAPRDPQDKYNSGFQGFVSREEIVMLVKHVEAPQRSPFSKECPQRPFECLISTLQKYPWFMVHNITIEERNLLFDATRDLLVLLQDRITSDHDTINLTNMLYKRVWRAALKCQGFTPTMKDGIVYTCDIDEVVARELGMAPYASHWGSLWAIGAKPNAPTDLILWYIARIREASEAQKKSLSLAEQSAAGHVDKHEINLFGDLAKFIGHDRGTLASMTLAEVARAEWTAIETLLRQALVPAIEAHK